MAAPTDINALGDVMQRRQLFLITLIIIMHLYSNIKHKP